MPGIPPIVRIVVLSLAVALVLAFPPVDAPMTGVPFGSPEPGSLLGHNQLGQDIALRVLAAAPITAALGVAAGAGTVAFALSYAAVVVLAPPAAGRIMMRLVDTLIAVPSIVPIMLLAGTLRPGPPAMLVLLIVFDWPGEVRLLSALVAKEAGRDSCRLARTFGAGSGHIVLRHVWPRLSPTTTALFVTETRRAVMHVSGLAFLGLGDPATPMWGAMLAEAAAFVDHPEILRLILPPLSALSVFLLALTAAGGRLEARARRTLGDET